MSQRLIIDDINNWYFTEEVLQGSSFNFNVTVSGSNASLCIHTDINNNLIVLTCYNDYNQPATINDRWWPFGTTSVFYENNDYYNKLNNEVKSYVIDYINNAFTSVELFTQ